MPCASAACVSVVSLACKVVQQTVALRAVVGAHAVDVALKIAVLDKFGEGELLKVGDGTGIKAQFFIKK